jgi:hypothetical protein
MRCRYESSDGTDGDDTMRARMERENEDWRNGKTGVVRVARVSVGKIVDEMSWCGVNEICDREGVLNV